MTDAPRTQPTVADQVAEVLRAEIRRGQVAPGTPLRQNEVAARLRVSSTPVREAFQILERAGLVVREGRKGVRVFRPSLTDLVNGYEVRIALESAAAGHAAERLTLLAREGLFTTVTRMHKTPPIPQEEYLRLNADLHAQIARGSGNRHLEDLIVSEQAATATYISFLGVDPASAEEAHAEHEAIIDSIMRGDSSASAAAMRKHLETRLGMLCSRLQHAAPDTAEVSQPPFERAAPASIHQPNGQ